MQGGFPNIRHIRVFLEASRTGSVSEAAELCHLSQPAATQAISALEADVGTRLLVRGRRQATLTPSGTLFAERCDKALWYLKDGALSAIREAGERSRRRTAVTLAVTASQLRNLIAIANSGSFTDAARDLGLSQPTVHRAAKTLEAAIGVPFFIARTTGVRLTPAAEAFVVGAKLAQAELRRGLEEISRELGDERGTFVLGSLPLARTKIVPMALHAMVSRYPRFQVRVVEGRYGELLRSLREGDVDCLIGALRTPAPADDVRQDALFDDALAIVAHPNHPLAGKQGLTINDTRAFPWIAPPHSTPAGQYLFDTLGIPEGPQSPVRVFASSMAVLRGVLAQGPYVSIVSRHQISVDEGLGAITALDVPLTGHLRTIGLTYREDWKPTQTQEHFLQYLRDYSHMAEQGGVAC